MILNKESKNHFFQYRIAISSILIIVTILAACSQNVNAYRNGVYWLCKDVDKSEYPYKPINPTTIFYDTDEKARFLFVIEYVTTSHNIIMKWYDPEDKLFDTDNHQIPHPRSEGNDYWATYSYYDSLPIKGEDAADRPGQWKVELYIDGNKQVTEFFEIRSTATTTLTTTTTTTPTTNTTSGLTLSPTVSPTSPSPTLPQEEMSTTTSITSTANQEEEKQVEQSSFLSNPMYIMLIVLSVIVIIILIVLAKRRKPITSQTQQIPNRYCINCGALAQPGEIFCGSCGKRVE
jgi:hypothetical protein